MVKRALHKYRAMCMKSNITSLDDLLRKLVAHAEKQTEKARESVVKGSLRVWMIWKTVQWKVCRLLLKTVGPLLNKECVDRRYIVL